MRTLHRRRVLRRRACAGVLDFPYFGLRRRIEHPLAHVIHRLLLLLFSTHNWPAELSESIRKETDRGCPCRRTYNNTRNDWNVCMHWRVIFGMCFWKGRHNLSPWIPHHLSTVRLGKAENQIPVHIQCMCIFSEMTGKRISLRTNMWRFTKGKLICDLWREGNRYLFHYLLGVVYHTTNHANELEISIYDVLWTRD